MAQPLTPTNIEALIEGNVSGQIAVGNYNVQIHAEHGAVVHFTPPGQQPVPRLRTSPVLLRPRPVRGLVDRQEDVAAALAAVGSCLPVEVHGPPGIGKSTLLRHLAHSAEAGSLRDGVVHLSARQQPAADLLQALFEAFYECDAPFKPTATQARHLLRDRKALILLDDCELGREAAEELLDTGPACAFVLASPERCLWGEGQAIHLGALPRDDARALFERELGRALSEEERSAFESLYTRLEGQPLRLLQAASQVREGRPVAEAVPIEEGTARRTLAPLPEEEKRLLSALAALGGGPIGAVHLGALADVPDPMPPLNNLLEHKLAQAHSPRYSLTGDLTSLLGSIWDLSPWCERALGYFTAWAEARREDRAALLEEAGTLRRLLDWATESGHHEQALQLGRALDAALAVSGRWDAWAQALERVRSAASVTGNRATEGWALHQLGSRLLCLDDQAGARDLLTQALAIRESLGDHNGAAVTRHNLGLLGLAPPPPSEPPRVEAQPRPLPVLPWLAAVFLVFLLMAGGVNWYFSHKNKVREEGTETAEPNTSKETTPSASEEPIATEPSTTEPVISEPPDSAASPGLELSRERVEFPAMALGPSPETTVETVSVTNTGTEPLRVAGVAFTDNPGEAFDVKSDCPDQPVEPGDQCDIEVTFHPEKPGEYHATLTLHADGLKRRTLEVSGAARDRERPGLDLSPAEGLDFGDVEVGQSRPLRVVVTNTGKAPLTVDAISIRGERAEEFDVGRNCDGEVLDPGKNCVFLVTFKPSAPGTRGLRLTVTDRTAGIEETLALRGNAVQAQAAEGWCCAGGQVFKSSEDECESRRGRLYPREGRARVACLSGCCVDGTFQFGVPEDECAQRQGVPMRAVEALLRCKKPEEGWCCKPGDKPFPSTREECTDRDGTYFDTEAEARRECAPPG
jgi:hypothetical protein